MGCDEGDAVLLLAKFEGQFPQKSVGVIHILKKNASIHSFNLYIHYRKRESKTSLTSQRAKLNKKDHSKQRLVTFFGLLAEAMYVSFICT